MRTARARCECGIEVAARSTLSSDFQSKSTRVPIFAYTSDISLRKSSRFITSFDALFPQVRDWEAHASVVPHFDQPRGLPPDTEDEGDMASDTGGLKDAERARVDSSNAGRATRRGTGSSHQTQTRFGDVVRLDRFPVWEAIVGPVGRRGREGRGTAYEFHCTVVASLV